MGKSFVRQPPRNSWNIVENGVKHHKPFVRPKRFSQVLEKKLPLYNMPEVDETFSTRALWQQW